MIQSLILFFTFAHLGLAAVTGEDDRLSFAELEKRNPSTLAKATATQLSRRYLKLDSELASYPSGKLQNQCPGEKFANEPTLGGCSGFLIAENILVAAGHCKDYRAGGCEDDAWLFNHFAPAKAGKHIFKTKDVFYCKKILDFKHDGEGDYVIMELDRKVPNITPLEMDIKNQGQKGDPVAILGYPLGRSFTYTPGGRILSKDKNFLRVDSDAFKNNSGSALFNIRTGKVEGILTNARRGMGQNPLDGCQLAKSYKENMVLVNRLKRIEYLQNNYQFNNKNKEALFKNLCDQKTTLIVKYRNKKENDWITLSKTLEPNEELRISDNKNDSFYLHAFNQSNSIIKGKDFWGFADTTRTNEYGFKSSKGSTYLLGCSALLE